MVTTTLSAPANADEQNYDPSWGNAKTAKEKIFADALYTCATTWLWNSNLSYHIYPEKIREGKWFEAYLGGGKTVHPLVEATVAGSYNDGKIWCDEGDNALAPSVIEAINGVDGSIGYKDIICDKTDGYVTGGILGRGNQEDECGNIYEHNLDDNYYFEDSKTNDEMKDYIQTVLGEGIFSPTGLEAYYMIHDAFIIACASGKASSNNTSPTYTIKEIGPDNTMIEVGYTGKNRPSPGDKVPHIMLNGGDFGAPDDSTCRDLEEALNNNEYIDKYAEYLRANGLNPEDSDDDNNNQAEKNCQNSGGAGSLGWIVCSILDWMSEATEGLYDGVVKPALRVEPELFQNGSSDTSNGTIQGAEGAWAVFRDFANILFIIIVLVVIFSQLTGFGIDNYGIKKILPKLIIVAILVNLSYLICLICVDLSNIAGNGVQDLFNSIDISGGVPTSTYGGVGFANNAGFVAVSIAGAAVGAVAIYSNPALLLTLFVSVLGVLISVLFLFILLAGRKAAIVLLTVISPIAIILYMLPNTKKIFDKWLNLWKAMLILYPACGLLIGGGNFASRLMVSLPNSSESAATVFVAMIVGIIPIFFIPGLVKSAYSALGSIGGTIAGFGGRLSGGATKGIRNSNAYKNTQQMGLDRKTRKQAGLNKQGDATKVGRLQRRMASTRVGRFIGADRRMNARTKAAKKEMAEQEEAAATSMAIMAASEMGRTKPVMAVDGSGTATGRQLFDGQRENYYASKFMQATEKKDRKAMNAALAAAKSAGVKDKDIAKMVRHAANTGKLSGKDNAQMGLWLQGQASTNNALAKDIELQDWAAKGGSEKLGNYGEYARSHMSPSDLDKNKVGNASTESMAGLAVAGKLPTSLAKEVLLDSTMNLSPDKRILLGAINEGKINTSASAEDLKRDADLLSTNPSAGVTNITATAADVNKWTAPTPRPVVIR